MLRFGIRSSKLFKALRWRHGGKRLVFCINSGRSGSGYLAGLLATAEEVMSKHEPQPTMAGKHLRAVTMCPMAESFPHRMLKAAALHAALRALPEGKTVYAETNHMFIKTYFDVVMSEFGSRSTIIVLRRNVTRVLRSFVQLGYFSDTNSDWQDWMSSPNAVTAVAKAIASDRDMDQFDRCIAYLVDIEARAERFMQSYQSADIHEVHLERIVEHSGAIELLRSIGVTPTPETLKFVGSPINERAEIKEREGRRLDIHECEDRLQSYLERARGLGIELPARFSSVIRA